MHYNYFNLMFNYYLNGFLYCGKNLGLINHIMDNDLIISEVDNNLLPDNSECMGLLSSKSYTTNSVLYSIIGCLLIIFVLLVLTGPVDTWLTVKFGDLPSK